MTIYLSYRDEVTCKGSNMQPGYARETVDDTTQMAKEQVFPGLFGYPAMHITHVQESKEGNDTLFLVALTSHALSDGDRALISEGGWKFLESSQDENAA